MSIHQLTTMINEEIARETKLKKMMESRLKIMPEGCLSVSKKNYDQYYTQLTRENGKVVPNYLKSDLTRDREIIKLLMEKRNITYGLPILNNNLKILSAIPDGLKIYNPLSTRYGHLLSKEYYLDDEICVRDWLKEKDNYARNPFKPEQLKYETKSGLLVRSKSEMMIADVLHDLNIPFKAEAPLVINGKTYYPDFELLHEQYRKLVWWEHLGLLDAVPGYARSAVSKIDLYAGRGITLRDNLILTWEDGSHPLTRSIIIRKLREVGFPQVS